MFSCPQPYFQDPSTMPFSNPYAYGDYNIYTGGPVSYEEQLATQQQQQQQQQLDFQHHQMQVQAAHQTLSRKRTFHESESESASNLHAGPAAVAFRQITPVKKRSAKPIETHIHASTLRRLFNANQNQVQQTAAVSNFSSAVGQLTEDLDCEDCDNTISLEEYTAEPDAYSCFACDRTVCWRCSLRAPETNSALECLQCAHSRRMMS